MTNQKYRKGIENVPLREINKECPIIVIVSDLSTDEVVQTLEMDYAKVDDRRWLGRLSFWAISNHHSVETMSRSDAIKENIA
jgi:hypothetical protein